MGGGIYDENDRRIARAENQRLTNRLIAERAVGEMFGPKIDRLDPPTAISPPSFDFFGTPKALLKWLGLDIGINLHTLVVGLTFLGVVLGSSNTMIQVYKWMEWIRYCPNKLSVIHSDYNFSYFQVMKNIRILWKLREAFIPKKWGIL